MKLSKRGPDGERFRIVKSKGCVRVRESRLNLATSDYFLCRILARMRRFLRPIFRRPLPLFFVPIQRKPPDLFQLTF